jgi:hypothetical protein
MCSLIGIMLHTCLELAQIYSFHATFSGTKGVENANKCGFRGINAKSESGEKWLRRKDGKKSGGKSGCRE